LTVLSSRPGKGISASSQNQAFNALLFFYRHVLKNEFGEIKDIPRAKRKPNISTVLSRKEADAITTGLKYTYGLVVKFLYDYSNGSAAFGAQRREEDHDLYLYDPKPDNQRGQNTI